jgi:hypothetical protein
MTDDFRLRKRVLHWPTAEEQVAIAAQNVARQRELVAELERDGDDASHAKKMLEQFLKQQALRIADRDRLVNEPDRRHIDGEDQLCFLCKS